MSKQLYIGNKRLVIDEDSTFFPFSYKISTLDEVSIIGVPVSKTVSIPRCSQNDEIFSYIGEMTRTTVGFSDDLVGVSFNQIKKCTYRLVNNSELVSTGLLVITNLTKESYEVMLLDIMIDKIETLGTKKLNEIDLYNGNDQIVDFRCTTANVLSNMNPSDGLVPTVNNKEFKDSGTDFLCNDFVTGKLKLQTLPTECSPLDIESIKNHDIDWSSNINNIIRSINHANLTQVTVDPLLTDTFNEIYLRGNSPKNKEILLEGYLNAFDGTTSSINVPINTTPSLPLDNGNYYMELNIDVKFQSTNNYITNDFLSQETIDGITTSYYNSTLPDGGYMGTYYIKTRFISKNSQNTITSSSLYLVTGIPLYKNVNVTEIVTPNSGNGYIGSLRLQENVVVSQNWYPYIDPQIYGLYLECSLSYCNPTNTADKTFVLGTGAVNGNISSAVYCKFPTFKLKSSLLKFTKLDFRTGDYINSSSILPSVTIKDFLLSLVKYLNLDLIVDGDNLKIISKQYTKSSKVLIIDSESTEINTNLLDMSSIKLCTELSDNKEMKDYETKYKKVFGEKIVNTGYNIKENVKEVKYDVSIPFLLVPTNNYSYDTFLRYFNGGYSKCAYGDVSGFDDKISFGYLQLNQRTIFINDDAPFETGGYYVGYSTQPTEEKFTLYNPFIWYYQNNASESSKYKIHNNISYKNNILGNFYTFSPYMFSDIDNTIVVKSLEFNKPTVNYAFIKDANYNESTTIYNRFHKNLTIDKYDVNTHVMKTKVYLDGKPDTRKIYNVKNSNYIISNLVEYDPTTPNMYDIELLKVNTDTNYQTPYNNVEVIKNYVSAENATSVSFTSATLNGTIKNKYGETYNDPTVTEKGFVYSYYNSNPFIGGANCVKVVSSTVGATFNSSLTSLITGYPLIYKAYIVTPLGTTYSNIVQFNLMSGGVPTLDRCIASNIGYFSFTCSGNITSLNGLNLIEKGIVYSSTVGSPTINDVNCVRVRDTSIGLGISITPTGLIDNTTYYMNTYAINEYGLSYGRTQITIGVPSYSTTYATTLDYVPVIPWYMVTEPFTDTLWSIKSNEITVPVRYVLGNDGRNISTFGAVYSTSDTTPNSGWSTSSGSVAFMGRTDYKGAIITGLSNATTYYVYSYGIDNLGTYRFGDKRVVTTLSILNQLSVVATLTPSNTANSVDLDLVSLTADNVPVSYGYQYGTDNTLSTYTEITSTIPWGVQYNHHTYMTQGGLSAGGTYYFRSWELYTSGEKRLSAIVSKTTGTGTGNYMSKTTTTYWDSYVKGQGDSYIACTKDSTNIDTLGLVNTSTGIFGKLPTSLFNKSITVTPKCRFFGRLYFNDLVVKSYDRQSYGVYNHEIIFKFFDYAGYKYIDGATGKYTIPLKSQQSLPHNIIYWIGAGKDYVEIMDKNLTTGDWEINHVGTPFTSSFGTSSIITNTFTINSPSFDSATINFQRQDSMIWGGITTPTGSEQTSVSSFKQLSLQKHPYLDALYNFTIDA